MGMIAEEDYPDTTYMATKAYKISLFPAILLLSRIADRSDNPS